MKPRFHFGASSSASEESKGAFHTSSVFRGSPGARSWNSCSNGYARLSPSTVWTYKYFSILTFVARQGEQAIGGGRPESDERHVWESHIE